MTISESVILTWQLLPDVTDCHIVDWVIFKWYTLGAVSSVWRGLSNDKLTLSSSPCRECDGILGGTNDAKAHLKLSVLTVSLVFYCYRCLSVRRRCIQGVFHFKCSANFTFTSLCDAFMAIWVRGLPLEYSFTWTLHTCFIAMYILKHVVIIIGHYIWVCVWEVPNSMYTAKWWSTY